jgi:hypothetical protein
MNLEHMFGTKRFQIKNFSAIELHIVLRTTTFYRPCQHPRLFENFKSSKSVNLK